VARDPHPFSARLRRRQAETDVLADGGGESPTQSAGSQVPSATSHVPSPYTSLQGLHFRGNFVKTCICSGMGLVLDYRDYDIFILGVEVFRSTDNNFF